MYVERPVMSKSLLGSRTFLLLLLFGVLLLLLVTISYYLRGLVFLFLVVIPCLLLFFFDELKRLVIRGRKSFLVLVAEKLGSLRHF